MSARSDIEKFKTLLPSTGRKPRGPDTKPRVRWNDGEVQAIAKRIHFHHPASSWRGIPLMYAVRDALDSPELKEQNVRRREIRAVHDVERVQRALAKLAFNPVPKEEEVIIEQPKTLKEIVTEHFKNMVLDDRLDFLSFTHRLQEEVLLDLRIEAEAVEQAKEMLRNQEPPKVDVSVTVKMPQLPPPHKARKIIRLYMHREKDKNLFDFLKRTYGKVVDFDHLFKNDRHRDHKHIRFDNRIDAIWIESSGVPSGGAAAVHKAANAANIPVEIFKSAGQLKSTAAFNWPMELQAH